jgi:CHAT domain-containing protein
MAVIVLARLLTTPVVDISKPEVAVIHVARENGTLRVDFAPPGVGAIVPSERMKLSDSVRQSLGENQRRVLSALGRMRGTGTSAVKRVSELSPAEELLRAGQYTYGHLIPPRIQIVLEGSTADHLRLDVDERLVDLPWELIHDGNDFLCLRYAAGRRIVSDQSLPPQARVNRPPRKTALVVANPTGDLPAAEREGQIVARLLREQCGLTVDYFRGNEISKTDFLLALRDYNLVHFAGHAEHNSDNPDESCLILHDGAIQAFEIARFLKDPIPSVVFLNACLSSEEAFDPESYSPMMRGLGRTFLFGGVAAFLGYLVPIPDESATRFATEFYSSLAVGRSVGESVRRARILGRERDAVDDLTWASAVLYGEPSAVVFESVPVD